MKVPSSTNLEAVAIVVSSALLYNLLLKCGVDEAALIVNSDKNYSTFNNTIILQFFNSKKKQCKKERIAIFAKHTRFYINQIKRRHSYE